ncbi:MAG: hypothetical protein ACOCVG_05245 [Verrucomicrobiota bacterium]
MRKSILTLWGLCSVLSAASAQTFIEGDDYLEQVININSGTGTVEVIGVPGNLVIKAEKADGVFTSHSGGWTFEPGGVAHQETFEINFEQEFVNHITFDLSELTLFTEDQRFDPPLEAVGYVGARYGDDYFAFAMGSWLNNSKTNLRILGAFYEGRYIDPEDLSQIPEPAHTAALLGLLSLLCVWRYQKRKEK